MDDHEWTFRAAALGDAMLATSRDAIPLKTRPGRRRPRHALSRGHQAEAEEATRKETLEKALFGTPKCEQQSVRHDGGRRDDLMQEYGGTIVPDVVAPTQSCWHKTVGGAFLDPASAARAWARAAARARSPGARTPRLTRSGARSSTTAWPATPSTRVLWRRPTACRWKEKREIREVLTKSARR